MESLNQAVAAGRNVYQEYYVECEHCQAQTKGLNREEVRTLKRTSDYCKNCQKDYAVTDYNTYSYYVKG